MIIRPSPGLPASSKHAPRVDFDARVGVDHDHGRFDRAEGADGLADEVGIAGRIEHLKILTAVIEMDELGSTVCL